MSNIFKPFSIYNRVGYTMNASKINHQLSSLTKLKLVKRKKWMWKKKLK